MIEPTAEQIAAEQIARLPLWAREYLFLSQRRYREMRKQLDDYLDDQTPSKVYTGWKRDKPRYLKDTRFTFVVPEGEITVSSIKEGLECMAVGYGVLSIKPRSGNVIHLQFDKYK